jgi:hypothetical protein
MRDSVPRPQQPLGQVDVGPLQGECLAAAQAGVHEQREQRCVPAAFGRAKQLGDLRGCQVMG